MLGLWLEPDRAVALVRGVLGTEVDQVEVFSERGEVAIEPADVKLGIVPLVADLVEADVLLLDDLVEFGRGWAGGDRMAQGRGWRGDRRRRRWPRGCCRRWPVGEGAEQPNDHTTDGLPAPTRQTDPNARPHGQVSGREIDCGCELTDRGDLSGRELLFAPSRQDAGDGQVPIVQPLSFGEKIVQRSLVVPGQPDRLSTLSAVVNL